MPWGPDDVPDHRIRSRVMGGAGVVARTSWQMSRESDLEMVGFMWGGGFPPLALKLSLRPQCRSLSQLWPPPLP